MSQPLVEPQVEQQSAHAEAKLAEAKLERLKERLKEEQNLTLGLFAGAGGALAGAALWALITSVTHFQIGWMAVGVGFLVGYGIRTFGKGIDKIFGVTGALLALVGCMAGNLLSVCVVIAREQNLAFFSIISQLDFAIALELMKATFHPMDLLFYGIAVYEGYRFSFRRITSEELTALPG